MAKKGKTVTKEAEVQLSKNHIRALELIESGNLTNKEISKACNIPFDSLIDLIDGRTAKTGIMGDLFAASMKEIQNRTAERVRFLAKDCTKLALQKVAEHLRIIQRDDMSDNNLKKLIAVINALGKTMPKIDIGQLNVQNNNFNSLTPFELQNEYQRLTNVARSLSKSRRLRELTPGGTGELSSNAGSGDNLPEESQVTDV